MIWIINEILYKKAAAVLNGSKAKPGTETTTCSKCHGTCGEGVETCPYCHGTGMITETRHYGYSIIQNSHPCQYCGGILSEIREHNSRKYRHCYACHFEFEEK